MTLVTWFGLLGAAYTMASKMPAKTAYLPASLVWNVFVLFLMFAVLSAVLRRKDRGFWTGVSIFGLVPILGAALNAGMMFYNPTTGQAVLELLGLGVSPDIAGDDAHMKYMLSVVPIADLVIASLTSLIGGMLGGKLTSTIVQSKNAG